MIRFLPSRRVGGPSMCRPAVWERCATISRHSLRFSFGLLQPLRKSSFSPLLTNMLVSRRSRSARSGNMVYPTLDIPTMVTDVWMPASRHRLAVGPTYTSPPQPLSSKGSSVYCVLCTSNGTRQWSWTEKQHHLLTVLGLWRAGSCRADRTRSSEVVSLRWSMACWLAGKASSLHEAVREGVLHMFGTSCKYPPRR